MKTFQALIHRRVWIFLFVAATVVVLSPSPACAQSIGPGISECSSELVDPYGYVTQTECLFGNGSQLYASNEVVSDNWSYIPEVDSETIMSDSDGSLIAYSGFAVQDLQQQAGTDAYTNLGTTPILNDVYTMSGNFGYCYDASGLGGQRSDDDNPNDVYCVWDHTNDSNTYAPLLGVITLPGSQGLLYPKAVVLDVVYAPPGGNSNVQYQNTTSVGTTSTNSYSFSQDIGYSVQSTLGVNASYAPQKGKTLLDGSVSLTSTQSADWIETQNSSNQVTLTKQASLLEGTQGFTTTSPPNGTSLPDLQNDWDQLTLWLNSELVFTAYPPAGNHAGFVVWGGYAWDPGPCSGSTCTFYGMDTFRVHVGCLNGHFLNDGNSNHANMCQGEQNILNRVWASNEGLVSPTTGAAASPALVFNTQNAWDLLAADPIAYNPDSNVQPYTLLSNPYQLPYTTSDGRYTQYCWNGTQPNSSFSCPNPLWYVYTNYTQYGLTQMNTQQQSSGGAVGVKTSVAVSSSASVGFLNIFSAKTTWTNTDTVTQTNTWLDTLATTQSVANAFTLKSDSPSYATNQFVVYQDNMYGTFMFNPFQ